MARVHKYCNRLRYNFGTGRRGTEHASNISGKDKWNIVDGSKKFGERIVRTDQTQIKAKLNYRGQILYWLGYAKNHSKGTYCVYNADTQCVVLLRDVTSFNETPKQQAKQNKELIDPLGTS